MAPTLEVPSEEGCRGRAGRSRPVTAGLTWLAAWAAAWAPLGAAPAGEEAVVVFNTRLPESKDLAWYYAERRGVPTNHLFGFDLPLTETMTRAEFRDQLQKPLLKTLEKERLLEVRAEIKPATRDRTGDAVVKVESSRVRYAVLCYGVPVRILADPSLSEVGAAKLAEPLRRNEAAVDSELAVLPLAYQKPLLAGPLPNPAFGQTNAADIGPVHGVLMVSRLDGPSVAIARGLVDKALAAETNGLWGRAYFDLRGLTNTSYRLGDQWLRAAADISRRTGFETIVDEKPETFPASFPLSHVAFYAGWYDGEVSGPFKRATVEFMPGAFAYHLYSFSAHVLRTADQYWVGPLLAKGATATIGFVEEPYLEGTPDLGVFWGRFVGLGFSFGEAAYAAQQVLSWQATVVGDPLYRPFGRAAPGDPIGRRFKELHAALLQRNSRLIEWSHLQVVNLNLAAGYPPAEMVTYLEQEPVARQSSILQEKLGDVFYSQGKLGDSIEAYGRAVRLETSPQQRIRLMLTLARTLALFTQEREALDLYRQFVGEFPDYPDRSGVLQRMLDLARGLNETNATVQIQEELKRLATPPGR